MFLETFQYLTKSLQLLHTEQCMCYVFYSGIDDV